jgi:hypothetical protein
MIAPVDVKARIYPRFIKRFVAVAVACVHHDFASVALNKPAV